MDVSTSSLKRGSYTITFDSVLSGTITLSGEQLQIGNDTPATDLSIQGPGARTITVSANEASRVFLIGELTNVTISGLTVSDGSALFGVGTLAQSGLGGGIYNEGTLELNDLTVSGNTATPQPPMSKGISTARATTSSATTLAQRLRRIRPEERQPPPWPTTGQRRSHRHPRPPTR